MDTIGKRIKSLRKAAGLTLDALGERVGVTKSSLSYIENDKHEPSARTVKLIAHTLNASEQWILTGEGDPKPEGAGTDLEAFISSRGCTESEAQLLRAFFSMTPAQRAATVEFIHRLAGSSPPPEE